MKLEQLARIYRMLLLHRTTLRMGGFENVRDFLYPNCEVIGNLGLLPPRSVLVAVSFVSPGPSRCF